jgi:hypothetical protein
MAVFLSYEYVSKASEDVNDPQIKKHSKIRRMRLFISLIVINEKGEIQVI